MKLYRRIEVYIDNKFTNNSNILKIPDITKYKYREKNKTQKMTLLEMALTKQGLIRITETLYINAE